MGMSSTKAYLGVLAAVAVLGAAGGAIVAWVRAGASAPVQAGAGEDANPLSRYRVADFALTDQDGRAVDQSVFDGRVTVLTFFYTSCPDPCPFISAAMRDVQDRTAGSAVRLASVSVDGEHDTPERVRAYAAGYGADFARWAWLTGDPADVGAMVRDSISFEMRDSAGLTATRSDGTKMAQILHPTRLILVGPDRRVMGLYAYNDPEAIDRLVRDAGEAARGG